MYGFHRDDSVALILRRCLEQRNEWLKPDEPPVNGLCVKVQMTTDASGILMGCITAIGNGFVTAAAERTADDEVLPCSQRLLTLRFDETSLGLDPRRAVQFRLTSVGDRMKIVDMPSAIVVAA